jgi:hypothetical protein
LRCPAVHEHELGRGHEAASAVCAHAHAHGRGYGDLALPTWPRHSRHVWRIVHGRCTCREAAEQTKNRSVLKSGTRLCIREWGCGGSATPQEFRKSARRNSNPSAIPLQVMRTLAARENIHENLRFPDTSIDGHECEAPPSLLADATSPLPVGRPRLSFAQLLSPAGEVEFLQAALHRVRLLYCLPACALFDRTRSHGWVPTLHRHPSCRRIPVVAAAVAVRVALSAAAGPITEGPTVAAQKNAPACGDHPRQPGRGANPSATRH